MPLSSTTLPTPAVVRDPNIEDGIKYWESQPANYDGVLGGFGNGPLPRVDALGTRQFLIHLLPNLCTVPSALRPLTAPTPTRRTRALDVGAGVGRVTADVLLPLFSDVVLVEPVAPFIQEALRRARRAPSAPSCDTERQAAEADERAPWKGLAARTKSVTFVQTTLQALDPACPTRTGVLARVGAPAEVSAGEDGQFDVIVCQWCLGALSDADLVAFFTRCKAALRDPARGVVLVKENVCSEGGGPRVVFDESDSSLTRSDLAWKQCFAGAGLSIIDERVQKGFPVELYPVKMYALR